jgi:hypothetical protein
MPNCTFLLKSEVFLLLFFSKKALKVLFLAEQKHNNFWTKFCNFDHSGMCANFQGSSSKLNLQGSPADGCVALTRQDGTARRGTARCDSPQ